jgi:hypothetical protein
VVWDPHEIRWVMDVIGSGESVRLCVNPCHLSDNSLCGHIFT